MNITNRDRFPDSEFLPEEEIKPYLNVDGQVYVLVGFEDGDRNAPLIAKASQDGELHAASSWEVIKHTQGQVLEIVEGNAEDGDKD